MVLRSCTSPPSREEQKDCSLNFPPEHCCALCEDKHLCEAYYGCEDCYVDNTTSSSDIKTLFSCCVGPISSKEFQEYIQKRPLNINLRR
jgi:hypothetical protein